MAFIGASPKLKRVRYTPQDAAPTNALEGDVFYSDGTALAEGLYVYKNSLWQKIGKSVGNINYIQNSDAESGVTGYVEYDDGASATPVDGTGGTASNITLSANTSSPLRGVADFKIAKGAADAQGEGVSYDFSIDRADTQKNLTISFDYKVTTNYADNDMGVYMYDVTNAAIINVTSKNILDNANTARFQTTFTASTSTSYRLIFHVQSTNATAYDFEFDNVLTGVIANSTTVAVVTARMNLTTGSHTNNTNWQDIPFNSTEFDTSSFVSGATFVAPETGYYYISASVGFGSSPGVTFGLRYILNGTAKSRTQFASSVNGIINISRIFSLTSGDIIKFQALQNSGGTLAYDTTDDTWMDIFKI